MSGLFRNYDGRRSVNGLITAVLALDEVATVSPRESSVRISIVVPYLGDNTRFEDSLVSVLENRPAGAEVCVAHDGSYRDPFDLGDEVRFVTARSANLPTLISAAVAATGGRFIHVIGNGVRATHGWTDAALHRFESDDAAIVAPLARTSPEGRITAGGWSDSAVGVIAPLGAGKAALGRRDAASIRGAYLTASFWRRSELQAAIAAMTTTDALAAEFAWSRLLTAAGWRCVLAEDSTVLAPIGALAQRPSFARGMTLRSLAAEIDQRSLVASVAIATLGNLFSPASWADTLGQAASLLREAPAISALRYELVHSPGEVADTIRMPAPMAQAAVYRRAA